MLKSCNSDCIEFLFLTNANIEEYLDTIPAKVEEITFWNYKTCLDPSLIPQKEVLTIPSLTHFTELKCVKFYNERIEVDANTFPKNVERVFFISCLVKNKCVDLRNYHKERESWLNVCVYRNNLKHINQYSSSAIRLNNVLGFLQQPSMRALQSPQQIPSPFSPSPTRRMTYPTRRRTNSFQRQPSNPFWKRLMDRFCVACCFLYNRSCKISPSQTTRHNYLFHTENDEGRGGIEMTDFVPFYHSHSSSSDYGPLQISVLDEMYATTPIHSLESIHRLKKIYDILINENIIKFLIGD
jgi:hypothetical protein